MGSEKSNESIFGTDGIRGKANEYPMTPDFILQVAKAAGHFFYNPNSHNTVVIGKDTRLSGYLIEPALTAGFAAMGMDVLLLGPLPTPAVAMLTRSMRADLGVMITASHNPYCDNGIKLFGPDGYKLSDQQQHEIEAIAKQNNLPVKTGEQLGRVQRIEGVRGRYIEWVKNSIPKGMEFTGMKIVIDAAHGACYRVAPQIFHELGAEVVSLNIDPNGLNINENSGAVYPEALCKAVLEHKADIGFAFDGDGDRLIVSDEKGHIIDGDQIIALFAKCWKDKGLLKQKQIVATQMSNLGLENYLSSIDLELRRVDVGDRYVLEYMRHSGCNLGGEQSGHIILSDYGTTGDGILAAIQFLRILHDYGQKVSDLSHVFEPVPQKLKNIRFSGENPLEFDAVKKSLQEGQAFIQKHEGRLFVRKSGTEPKIRIMAECNDRDALDQVIEQVADSIEDAFQK